MATPSDPASNGIFRSPRHGSKRHETPIQHSTPPSSGSYLEPPPHGNLDDHGANEPVIQYLALDFHYTGQRERPKMKSSPPPINIEMANLLEQDLPQTIAQTLRRTRHFADDDSWSVTTYSSADGEQDDMDTEKDESDITKAQTKAAKQAGEVLEKPKGLKEVSEYTNSLRPLYSASKAWAPAPDGTGAIPACILEHRPCDSTCRHGVFHIVDLAKESFRKAMEEKRLADASRNRESQIIANRNAEVNPPPLPDEEEASCDGEGATSDDEEESPGEDLVIVNKLVDVSKKPCSLSVPCPYVNKATGCKGQNRRDCIYQHWNANKPCMAMLKQMKLDEKDGHKSVTRGGGGGGEKTKKNGPGCRFGDKCAYVHPPPNTPDLARRKAQDLRPYLGWVINVPANYQVIKPCPFVNSPRGCRFGSKCIFNHTLEGVQCPDEDENGDCPRHRCPLLHNMCMNYMAYQHCACKDSEEFNHPDEWVPGLLPPGQEDKTARRQPDMEVMDACDAPAFGISAPGQRQAEVKEESASGVHKGSKRRRSIDEPAEDASASARALKRARVASPPANAPTGPRYSNQVNATPQAQKTTSTPARTRAPPVNAPKGPRGRAPQMRSYQLQHQVATVSRVPVLSPRQRPPTAQPPTNAPRGPRAPLFRANPAGLATPVQAKKSTTTATAPAPSQPSRCAPVARAPALKVTSRTQDKRVSKPKLVSRNASGAASRPPFVPKFVARGDLKKLNKELQAQDETAVHSMIRAVKGHAETDTTSGLNQVHDDEAQQVLPPSSSRAQSKRKRDEKSDLIVRNDAEPDNGEGQGETKRIRSVSSSIQNHLSSLISVLAVEQMMVGRLGRFASVGMHLFKPALVDNFGVDFEIPA
ncbi:hypothetical protein FB567DRAFT_611119 [Paraphoma chrysanthemicola]|uniref:C3H1-type domain-containing protein n=1 Tax=Paraphoma chrysanthemicola TaxID=798071 RepID=A0A8K0QVV9_9PLEO|nr:hypothetical protein FB567DRAFT_611119 [Paraphoma chrysanthemicola]